MSAPAPRPAFALLARGLLLPLAAGACAVFAFAPFGYWPVALASLAVLFHVWSGSGTPLQAALSGIAFGLGLNLAGVSWVFVSLHEYGHMPAVLAAVATFLFCAFVGLFPGFAGWAALRFGGAGPWRALLAFPAWFALFEWVRGWIFTGFPWLVMGYSQVPASPLAGFAPVLGVYGVSFVLALAAATAAALVTSAPWSRQRGLLLACLAALFALGGLARLAEWTVPAGEPVAVSLLQGNVSQHLKFKREMRAVTLEGYHAMATGSAAKVVILPETALPAFLDQLPDGYLDSLRQHGRERGKDILLGTAERRAAGGADEYFNSVVTVGASPFQAYRKRHLVPFGEFIPPGFGWVLSVLRIPLQDMSRGEARQPPLRAGGVDWAVAICYEDAFGEELIESLPQAALLANVTNDAWYGESLAAEQHLQLSQMRALETGRWMLRATNTGVTAAIDERGRVVSTLPQFTRGELLAKPVPRSGATPYVRWGNHAALALVAAALAAAFLRRRDRSRPAASGGRAR